jgi:RNA polymerase sigma-70 factor (ECF subfamily)
LEAAEGEGTEDQYVLALRADLLERIGRTEEAAADFRRAAEAATNEAERRHLLRRADL